MKRLSAKILLTEEIIAGFLLILISTLVFVAALGRKVGFPLNWAQDISLLAFAWLTFIGSDIVVKSGKLIDIDMVIRLFPKILQKAIAIVFDLLMILFLIVLIVYGFLLVSQSWSRVFNTLKLSYAWCTLSVPIGSILLLTTMVQRLIKHIRQDSATWEV